MQPHPLDDASALGGAPGDARRSARTDARYWTFISPFGGASAATALRAVLERPERDGDPLAITVNFCAPIAQGAYEVVTTPMKMNRSSQHWNVEFRQADAEGREGVVLTASVVTAIRRDAWSHQPARVFELPPAETLPRFTNPRGPSFAGQYELRFAEGVLTQVRDRPLDPPASARSRLWMRDDPPRPLDFVSLVAMSDVFFGRIAQVVAQLPPFGTVSLTTHFHASAAELAAVGSQRLLAQADANVFHRSYFDQRAELYAPSGALLATSSQVAFYKV